MSQNHADSSFDHSSAIADQNLAGGVAIAPAKRKPLTLEQELFSKGHEFDFFQAAALLEMIYPERKKIGSIGGLVPAAVQFAANSKSMSFAASAIYDIQPSTTKRPIAKMTVGFMGLTGPAGILPQHYTELMRRIDYEARGPQKYALRDWFDLFNDRLIAMFYQSWKKYRPFTSFRNSLFESKTRRNQVGFSNLLQSLIGIGQEPLSRQVRKFVPAIQSNVGYAGDDARADADSPHQETWANTSEEYAPQRLALLRYSGLLSQRPRCADNLVCLLEDYFQQPVEVKQFHGNWLSLDDEAQTRLGAAEGNCILGGNAVVGNQTWERQNKILVRVGPLDQKGFDQLLPDFESAEELNQFQLLRDLIRLFVGPELEFDVQLSIETNELPVCQLNSERSQGIRLGWNSWLPAEKHESAVAHDSVFCDCG